MHNWKELVRVRLMPLPLEATRREEIIEELAQQLEGAYNEAVAGGASDSEALHRSLAQFKDWEDLRRGVFRAVKAEELPVWEQNGILSPRRPVVWIALTLSCALLGLVSGRRSARCRFRSAKIRGQIDYCPRVRSARSSDKL
jgi:hypothetical protein